MENSNFRDYCTAQIERLGGAFPDFRFYRSGAIEELVNWLEAKSAGDEPKAAALVTEICEFESLPSIAEMNATWWRLFAVSQRLATPECRHCDGSAWEVTTVVRGGIEYSGAKRCRCGGSPTVVCRNEINT